MKAIVMTDIGVVSLEERPDPKVLNKDDAIVRVTTAGICGSDLHIVHGRDEGVRLGTIMGHEFIGIVEDRGSGAAGLEKGDRVVSPFTINCGDCFYCNRELPGRCLKSSGFGFVTEDGKGLEGSQAEFVRVPLASSTLMKIPEHPSDEELLFLGDIFSTAYSTAEGAAIKKGDTVLVVGCGPVGLLCVLAAKMFEPSNIVAVDSVEYRLEKARQFGAIPVRLDANNVQSVLLDLTEGRGADAALEAVGHSSALDLAIHSIRPGGVVSIAGYHTESSFALPIQFAYTKNLTLRIGRCNARKYMSRLLPVVLEGRIPLTEIITHILPLNDGVRGYEIFSNRKESAIKVLLKP